MRRAAIVATGVVFAALGPRISALQDRSAGEAFAYEAPEGFIESKSGARNDEERERAHAATEGQLAPRITLKRSKSIGTVEPADLAKIARGMPEALASSGITWTDVRRETRTRPDGTRVGLIEGACAKETAPGADKETAPGADKETAPGADKETAPGADKETAPGADKETAPGADKETAPGADKGEKPYRRLVFVFPVDGGTAITTALYGKDEIAKWQPVLEATIAKARGVALRVPSPPNWMYGAWAVAGLVIGWLGAALLGKKDSGPEKDAEPA